MQRYVRRATVLAVAVAATLALAGCGTDPTATPTSAPTATPTPTATPRPGVTPTPPTPTPTATPIPARDLEAYFQDKRITFWVGFAPGGGYDTFARIIGKFMPQYIPGNPSIIVRNVAGAGGLNGLVALAKDDPDGFAIGYMHPRFVNQELISGDVEGFDLDMVTLVGAPSSLDRSAVQWVRADRATSLRQMIASGETYTFGGTAPGAIMWGPSTTMYAKLGVPIRYVYGYGGSAESAAATDRGEVDMCWNPEVNAYSVFPEWVEEKFCAPIFYQGIHPSEDPSTTRVITDMGWDWPPLLWDVIDVDPDLRSAAELGLQLFDALSRTVVLPAGTPDDITEAIREGFRLTTLDPNFVAAAETAGLSVGHGDPVKLQEAINTAQRLLENPELRALAEATLAGD